MILTTTNLSGSACLINQHATNNPTASKIVMIVNQSFRAHHSVSKKHTPSTILATLLATILNPQNVSSAPIRLDPRYPAGSVMACFPPRMCVTPPSCGSSEMDSTRPPVQHAVMAWPNSWKAITSIYIRYQHILGFPEDYDLFRACLGLIEKTHLKRPQHPPHIRQIPQQRNHHHVRDDHAQRHALRVVHR